MASIKKTASGKYKFTVTINYKQETKTFATKAEGYLWEEMLKAGKGKRPSITLRQLLEKYRDEVTPQKKGRRWEYVRINKFISEFEFIDKRLEDISTADFSDWRNQRMKDVSALSVLREIATLNPIFNQARDEWLLIDKNPLDGLKKPKKPPARDRLISQDEIDRMCHCLGYHPEGSLKRISSRAGAVFMFAIETAMRCQEICRLRWQDVTGNVLKVEDSKTPTGIREVPLSSRAMQIIEQCRGIDEVMVFGIRSSQRDALFRKARKMAKIEDLHFHDTRHEAITRLAKKLDVLELARMVGHKNINELLTYYNEKASNIAKKLD